MESRLMELYKTVLANWNTMQHSEMEDAEEDAERFETSFHVFTDELDRWIKSLTIKPKTVEEAYELSEINEIMKSLPGPLQLNLETELEITLDEINKG